MQKVDQIDQGLARLYKLKKCDYDGGFKGSCVDNGFDDDDAIEEEMQSAIDESQLADEEFLAEMCPWIKTKGDERRQEIFDILKECHRNPDAYTKSADADVLQVTEDHFDLKPEDVERAKKKALDQAPEIFNAGFSNDEVLCMMFAVSEKTKQNYMLFLVDMFLREAVHNHYTKTLAVFETVEWGQNNKHIKELNNITIPGSNKSAGVIATAAVKSYLHRVAPKIMLKSTSRIKGNLESVCQYIYQTVDYVHKMTTTQQATCPFQYDSVYAFQEKVEEDNKSDGGYDDDDDDDDEKGDEDGQGSANTDSELGDLLKVLKDTNLKHVESTWKLGMGTRALDQSVKELGTDIGDKNYPRFHRFVSIVDFRDEADNAEPKLFVFGPQDGADKVHKNPSALNFFHNSKRSILPNPDKNDDDDVTIPTQTMTATSQGPQITLSFHVDSEESMRCYFYINGQCTRFMPADLKMLLPLFFEDNKANNDFTNGKEILRLIKEMEGKLKDDAFEAFLKKYKVECPPMSAE